MNLAIRTSRFDRPPQSCVVSVIWTCVNTKASRFVSLQSHIEPKRRLFAAFGPDAASAKHLRPKRGGFATKTCKN